MILFKSKTLAVAVSLALSGPVFAAGEDIPFIEKMNASVSTLLTKIGQAASDQSSQQTAVQGQLVSGQIIAQRDLMVQQEIANSRVRGMAIYGEAGTDPNCSSPALSVQAGRIAMQQTRASGGASMESRARSGAATGGSTKQITDIMGVQEADITAANIYPATGTLTDAAKAIVANINQKIIDPLPPAKLPPKLKTTYKGSAYEATRLLYEMQKEAPRNAQNVIQSMKTNDFPVNEWATNAWADMGKTGPIDGAVDNNMSYDAFIQLFVKSRVDSDSFYKKAVGANGGVGDNDVWQLRQINLNTAMLLEIQYQQLQISKNILELMAQERATNIDKEYLPQLDQLKADTAAAQ